MDKLNRNIIATVIASESIHIFCCVLPTVFSVVSLLTGAGILATMPSFMDQAHNMIHAYELPMIIMSGVILLCGWGLYAYSVRINCRTEGSCAHAPCKPKKNKAKIIMIAATVLFVFNVAVYFTLHRNVDTYLAGSESHAIILDHEGHAHHNH